MNEERADQAIKPMQEAFENLRKESGFIISPCEGPLDWEDKSRFTKMKIGTQQATQISALMQQIPSMLASEALTNAYTVKFPQGLPHTLTALKQGGFSTMIRGESGKFAGTASLYPMAAEAALLGAFTAMSVASGQYFLAKINNEMRLMNLKLDEILEFLYGDKKAELMSEMSFIQYAYQNYASIMDHEAQRQATLVSLQQSKKVAMKDIEFYISDLDAVVSCPAKNYEELEQNTGKALQIRESLALSQQLFVMSSVMEVYYAQNLDNGYLSVLERDMLAYIDKCDKRTLASFSKLDGRVNDYKASLIEKIDKSHAEKEIRQVVDALNSGEESAMRKTLRTALHAADKPMEFYLVEGGNVYRKSI